MAEVSFSLTDITGIRIPTNAFVVIVKTEWNKDLVNILLNGCTQILEQESIKYKILEVPGAVELTFAIKNYWDTNTNNQATAFIALGCVIKGDTPHFDYVCSMVSSGITQLNIVLPVPTIFGVLTVNNLEQAHERLGGAHGHKGREAAATAIKMIALHNQY